jgi:hypothetical protein
VGIVDSLFVWYKTIIVLWGDISSYHKSYHKQGVKVMLQGEEYVRLRDEAASLRAQACKQCQYQRDIGIMKPRGVISPTADNVSVRVQCDALNGQHARVPQVTTPAACPHYQRAVRRRERAQTAHASSQS